MHTSNSNKLPFLLAVGAVGGAVGYLFFTDSGRRKLDTLSQGPRRFGQIPREDRSGPPVHGDERQTRIRRFRTSSVASRVLTRPDNARTRMRCVTIKDRWAS